MTLPPGTHLGPYEIQSVLGSGGMGEVYRARDTRLDRAVAIKIVSAAVSDRPEHRERFEREARTISRLSHPHICALYDVGRQDGVSFLVMEYLEGETLAARLSRAALSLDEVLRYATEIAAALNEAHRQGITHRDLKPANIVLTRAGAKLVDFGIAKWRAAPPAARDVSSLATQDLRLTGEGSLVGTFHYMAPEQLQGRDADGRSDLFAFGAVLYEMVTRATAFDGANQASVIAAVLERDPPPMATRRPDVPAALERIVRPCLAKNPDARWQSAHDLLVALTWVREGGPIDDARPAASPRSRRLRREHLAWTTSAVAGIALIALAIAWSSERRQIAAPLMRFSVDLAPTQTLTPIAVDGPQLAMSPDGRHLVFVASMGVGPSSLWLRPLDDMTARALSGTDDASLPFWSPDSRSIAFFAQGKLKKIDIAGGPAQILCDALDGLGGTWGSDNVIVFTPGRFDGLFRIAARGSAVTPVTQLNSSRQETSHRFPRFLPDGRRFLYFAQSGDAEATGIYAGSTSGDPVRRVDGAGAGASYVTPGFLLFVQQGTLMAQRFDSEALQLLGEAKVLADQVMFGARFGQAAFSASDTGAVAYVSRSAVNRQLRWVARTGRTLGTIGPPADYLNPRLAPDEQRLAVDVVVDPAVGIRNLWTFDLSRGVSSRITFDRLSDWFPVWSQFPVWSPDRERIMFTAQRTGHPNVFQKASSGLGKDELLFPTTTASYVTDWSADGSFVVLHTRGPGTRWDLWFARARARPDPAPYLTTPFNEVQGRLSPDGRWVAYTSDESGRQDVYVQSFPTPGEKWRVSSNGGYDPSWRRDGRELFYISGDQRLVAVAVSTQPVFAAGAGVPLFDIDVPAPQLPFPHHYAPAADGQRFIVSTPIGRASSSPITVILNWTAPDALSQP